MEAEQKRFQPVNEREQEVRKPGLGSGEYRKRRSDELDGACDKECRGWTGIEEDCLYQDGAYIRESALVCFTHEALSFSTKSSGQKLSSISIGMPIIPDIHGLILEIHKYARTYIFHL